MSRPVRAAARLWEPGQGVTEMGSALILAGGRSTRFGDADKLLADVAGRPMIRRVADRVVRVTNELVVNCRDDQRAAVDRALEGLDYRVAIDSIPDRGPVAGMQTGLGVASVPEVAVVAGDMPLADSALFDRLFEQLSETDAAVAVPRTDGRLQPLHAVYEESTTRTACEEAIAAGSVRLQDVLARIDATVVDVDEEAGEPSPFTNVNTRADLRSVTDWIEAENAY